MLVAAGVSKSHGAQVVLEGVDLVVPPHARIGLVGPNGAGKSTLLRLLAGLDEPDRGTIRRPANIVFRPASDGWNGAAADQRRAALGLLVTRAPINMTTKANPIS